MCFKINFFILFMVIIYSVYGAAIPDTDDAAVLTDYKTETTDTDQKFA